MADMKDFAAAASAAMKRYVRGAYDDLKDNHVAPLASRVATLEARDETIAELERRLLALETKLAEREKMYVVR